MNRKIYFDFIEEQLAILAERIKLRGKLNDLSLNIHSEYFYRDFLNLLYGWNLRNKNDEKQNAEAIDLIDEDNKIIVSVSAVATKGKIESSFSKDLSLYKGYRFIFISISKDSDNLRKSNFDIPDNLLFTPRDDIYDITTILRDIRSLPIEILKNVHDFIQKELSQEIDFQRLETNLADIIKILSQEDWDHVTSEIMVSPYEVERKIEHNNLDFSKDMINDYKIYYNHVDKIYSEFDKQGANKTKSVLDAIRRCYIQNKKINNNDDLFFKIIDCVIEIIQKSKNYQIIPFEELQLCVSILVVDAFIRCKIYESPKDYHATSR